MKRTILAVVSDTHGGHRLGLMNPDVLLYEETEDGELEPYTPEPTSSQKYLWRLYLNGIKATVKLAAGDDIIMIHNGDLTQGHYYKDQLVSTRMADQILIAAANIAPWMKVPGLKMVRLASGTQSHIFGENSATVIVHQLLVAKYNHIDIKSVNHGLMDIAGLQVDYAHHGPYPGSRIWLKGNVARYYLRDLMMRCVMESVAPPGLVLRSHYHEFVKEYLHIGGHDSWLVITPSVCMLGDYARQATRSTHKVTMGMLAVELVDGRLIDIHKYTSTVDIRTKEVVYG